MSELKMRVAVLSLFLLAPLSACEKAQAQQPPQIPPSVSQPPQGHPQQPATRESQAFPSVAPLVESVKSAVVNVDVQSRLGGRDRDDDSEQQEDLLNRYFNGNGSRRRREQLRTGLGSGTIIDGRGLVLTNNHVVEGAVVIRVRLDDGRAFDAEVVGRDPLTDVALIRLKGKLENLPVVKLGDSEAMRAGDWVLAIGNPFGLTSSVSLGIISAKARNIHAGPYDDFLQTDAAINPGNSGGPLFNMKGEVIGINTAIVGGGTGIGFAVPSNLAKALLPQLEKEGAVTRGWLGIGVQSLTSELARALGTSVSEGAIVVSVNPGSPARKAGVQQDDVIVALDGEKVASSDQLTRTVALKRPNSTVILGVMRDGGKRQDVKVQLGTRPDLENGGAPREPQSAPEEEGRKLRIGMSFTDLDPRIAQAMGMPIQGAMITDVVPGSAADRAELSRGMIVTEADHRPIRTRLDLDKALRGAKSGSAILLRVQMPGQEAGSMLRALSIP